MLVKAMEVSGIEGNFRSTCENVMQVLRLHKDSVMAMMEVNFGITVYHLKYFSLATVWGHNGVNIDRSVSNSFVVYTNGLFSNPK